MIHWAQYMDVEDNDSQIALVDYNSNARPAWHAFNYWGDIPTERVVRALLELYSSLRIS